VDYTKDLIKVLLVREIHVPVKVTEKSRKKLNLREEIRERWKDGI